MFRAACETIEPCLCRYYGVLPNGSIAVMGSGCLLAGDIVLTARHLLIDTYSAGGQPKISKRDGAFECELVWENASSDLAILRTTTCVSQGSQPLPANFPPLADFLPAQGMLVGYMGYFRRDGGAVTNFRYFSGEFVSFVNHHDQLTMRYVMSGGFIEGGFSGGPVFLQDGRIIGVLVSSFQSISQGLILEIPVALPEFASICEFSHNIVYFCGSL